MKGLACCVLAGLTLASLAGCHKGQVRLQRAPGLDSYVWRDPISADECRALYEGLLYVVTARVGYAQGREGKEGFIVNAQLRWNDAVRPLGGLFDELCKQHNEALVTLSEFEARKTQFGNAASVLIAQHAQLDATIADYRAAWEREDSFRGAEGPEAAAQLAQAHQRMVAASQTADRVIQEAAALVEGLGGPRTEARVMAGE